MRKLLPPVLSLLLIIGCAAPAQAVNIVEPQSLYTYSAMCEDISQLAAAYPELISVFSIGGSVEGRDLSAFRLGRGTAHQVIICASMHGREYVSSAFIMYMAERYCQGYRSDSSWNGLSYRQALDNVSFYIVPMLNPDGVTLAQMGLNGVSPARRDAVAAMPILELAEHGYAAWKSNINGVDLNRNFPYKWGLKIKAAMPASWEYIGPYPASEPETQAMQALLDRIDYDMLISLHSMGEVIFWLDTDTVHMYDEFYPLSRRLADAFGYKLMEVEDTTAAGGFMVNSERVKKGKFCLTIELGDKLFQPDFERISSRVYGLGLLLADHLLNDQPLPQISVTVNGAAVVFPDQLPFLSEQGRTLVPLRPVLEACGCAVEWDQLSKTVYISRDAIEVRLVANVPLLFCNGVAEALDSPPLIVNERLMLPVRAVAEAFGYSVSWDEASRTVMLTD